MSKVRQAYVVDGISNKTYETEAEALDALQHHELRNEAGRLLGAHFIHMSMDAANLVRVLKSPAFAELIARCQAAGSTEE